jgi:MFS family permease
VALSGKSSYSGLFIALFYVGAAAGAALAGRAMDRFGRRPVLVIGYATAAIGFAIAGGGVTSKAFAVLIAGTLVLSLVLAP